MTGAEPTLLMKSVPPDALETGLHHHECGRLTEAEAAYCQILAVDPNHADALHLLGVINFQTGRSDLAATSIARAIALDAGRAPYHNNLGNALRTLGRTDEAIQAFQAALRLRPHSAEIHSNLGNALKDAGRLSEAAIHYRLALDHKPDLPEVCYNLANTLFDQGDSRGAESYYREALRLRPTYPEAFYNLGNVLVALCRTKDAEASYRSALKLQPDHPETHNNLGAVLQDIGRLKDAETCYRMALSLKPSYPEAHFNLGCVYQAHGRIEEAANCYRQTLAHQPDHGPARIALLMAQLPILYTDETEITRRRAAYEDQLRRLCQEVDRCGASASLAGAIGTSQPFFLAYQGANDRQLQCLFGGLATRLLAETAPVPLPRPRPGPAERIRVGMVSGFFHDHTVWRLLLAGWLSQFDRSRFELFAYHTGIKRDAETQIAAGLADHFVAGRFTGTRWREIILADAPHVLLYPEIGMDSMSAHLAAQRLAAVQCVSWGHPDTTGLSTIDYFLSSALMEPEDGQEHYSETLVRLPNLATWFEPGAHRPLALGRADLGLRPSATVYWSAQALYKYLPQHDDVFPRIAKLVGDCQFVFIEFAKSRAITDLFRQRLIRTFEAHGLKFEDHCIILPPMEQDMFIAALGLADIILDTIGWSGGRSALDCLSHNRPFVTLPGPLMRGRHTAAILERMGVRDTIAGSLDNYIALAARLGLDPEWRATVAGKIRDNKHRVFFDRETISALEDFLVQAARR